MKQYAVVAYDYTDDEALERRLANREAHLEGIPVFVFLASQDASFTAARRLTPTVVVWSTAETRPSSARCTRHDCDEPQDYSTAPTLAR